MLSTAGIFQEADRLVEAFRAEGILSAVAGEAVPAKHGLKIVSGGAERSLEHPQVDAYWILAARFSS